MISAVSNRGLMRFMLYEGALNADGFIAFLRRLIKDAGRKVVNRAGFPGGATIWKDGAMTTKASKP
jgi:hypothetical protein